MKANQTYSLREIQDLLADGDLPLSGTTQMGSAEFHFLKPSWYAGIAIHAGSNVRDEILTAMKISRTDRYREEDPYTECFIRNFPIRIIARDSRFEYDLNRDRDEAIYTIPEMAWGLDVWNQPLTSEEIDRSITKYDEFHKLMDIVTAYLLKQNRYGVIFDFHSYNYQREEKVSWHIDENPVINIGTEPVNRDLFGEVIDNLLFSLSGLSISGHPISVGENVIFKGGGLSNRLSSAYYDQLLFLAIEFKKIFMDEWSGRLFEETIEQLADAFCMGVKQVVTHPFLSQER
jgi:hypothetical protein